jgi:ABC-2 type transport system ATP-binding protein
VIIANGTIRASGSRQALRDEHSAPRYEILLGGDAGWLRNVSDITVIELDGGYALFDADPDAAQRVLQSAIERGPVASFAPQHPSLAQIFREVIK